jgi:inhibitor of KinA
MGESGLVVELGDAIDPGLNARVRWLAGALGERLAKDGVELVPTYRSLLVIHDPLRLPRARLVRLVQTLAAKLPREASAEAPTRLVRVPACYGGELGPDLDFVAGHHHLRPEEVIALHSEATYLVYMLGFTPGFPYLGGMTPRLATPRLPTPRARLPAGSVAIGGAQTGIYPVESPGGWRLIGRTPLRLFDPDAPAPFLLAAGDRLRFVPVSRAEYDAIAARVAAGTYRPDVEPSPRGDA